MALYAYMYVVTTAGGSVSLNEGGYGPRNIDLVQGNFTEIPECNFRQSSIGAPIEAVTHVASPDFRSHTNIWSGVFKGNWPANGVYFYFELPGPAFSLWSDDTDPDNPILMVKFGAKRIYWDSEPLIPSPDILAFGGGGAAVGAGM